MTMNEKRRLGICQNASKHCASPTVRTVLPGGRVEERFCENCLRQRPEIQPPKPAPLTGKRVLTVQGLQEYQRGRDAARMIDRDYVRGGFHPYMRHAR